MIRCYWKDKSLHRTDVDTDDVATALRAVYEDDLLSNQDRINAGKLPLPERTWLAVVPK